MKQSAELLDTKAAMQIRYLEMVEELGKRGATLMMDIGVEKKGIISYGKENKLEKDDYEVDEKFERNTREGYMKI